MRAPQRKYWISARPNAYGFGHDWDLVVKAGKKKTVLMLGQDAKVVSRALGMRMEDAVDYYAKKAGSKEWEKVEPFIADDVVRASLGLEQDGAILPENIKQLAKAQPWEMAVE